MTHLERIQPQGRHSVVFLTHESDTAYVRNNERETNQQKPEQEDGGKGDKIAG